MPAFGNTKGSYRSPFISFSTSIDDNNKFYGFESQSIEEDVMTLASLAFVTVDKQCSTDHKEYVRQREAEEKARAEEAARLEQERLEQEAAAAARAAEEEERKRLAALANEDGGGEGGAIAAVVVIIVLLIAGGIWFYFSDKACCCLKDKIRMCKTRCKNCLKDKCTRKQDRI